MNLLTQETCPTPDYCTIPLTKGFVAIVDVIDYDRLASVSWKVHFTGIGRTKDKPRAARQAWDKEDHRYRTILMHRVIMDAPAGITVDHIDGNGLNNRRLNLRLATYSQNARNRVLRSDNKSGFIGVHFKKREKKWYASLDKGRRVGPFDSPTAAAHARDCIVKKIYEGFEVLNGDGSFSSNT